MDIVLGDLQSAKEVFGRGASLCPKDQAPILIAEAIHIFRRPKNNLGFVRPGYLVGKLDCRTRIAHIRCKPLDSTKLAPEHPF